MTTNERLVAAGLLAQWDSAVRSRDREAMISLLQQVEIASAGAAEIADTVLANPARYGF
jgi:predicted protein tyrosine phosphatase